MHYLIFNFTDFAFPDPSVARAVMVTVFPRPLGNNLTVPELFTVAYDVLELLQESDLFAFLFVVFTVAFTFTLFPAFTFDFEGLFSFMLFTAPFMM